MFPNCKGWKQCAIISSTQMMRLNLRQSTSAVLGAQRTVCLNDTVSKSSLLFHLDFNTSIVVVKSQFIESCENLHFFFFPPLFKPLNSCVSKIKKKKKSNLLGDMERWDDHRAVISEHWREQQPYSPLLTWMLSAVVRFPPNWCISPERQLTFQVFFLTNTSMKCILWFFFC